MNFKSRLNVYLCGWVDYAELPKYIHSFDVCIIPYVINEFTKGIYPLKLHEYLAAGKPIVSTPLPEIEQFLELVRIGKDRSEFEHAITESLKEKNKEIRRQRISIARENTWEKCAESALSIIAKSLEKNGSL